MFTESENTLFFSMLLTGLTGLMRFFIRIAYSECATENIYTVGYIFRVNYYFLRIPSD